MVAVLLTILKVIGFVLLGIVGLVLFLILLLMISPFRYRLAGSYYGKPDVTVYVSWLLHIVSAGVVFDGEKLGLKLRVFGIPVIRKDDLLAKGEDEGEDTEGSEEEQKESEEKDKDRDDGQDGEKKKKEPINWSEVDLLGWVDDVNDAWQEKKEQIAEKLEELQKKLHSLKMKLKLISDERTQAAIKLIMKKVMRILKGMMPRKASGHVHFGLEDPAETGKLLAYLAMTIPLQKNALTVEPDFTDKVFEGEGKLKGRIFLAPIVFAAIVILLNKDVRITYKRYKRVFKTQEG